MQVFAVDEGGQGGPSAVEANGRVLSGRMAWYGGAWHADSRCPELWGAGDNNKEPRTGSVPLC